MDSYEFGRFEVARTTEVPLFLPNDRLLWRGSFKLIPKLLQRELRDPSML